MIRLGYRHGRWLIAAAALVLVCILRASGVLQSLENDAADARARLLAREVPSDIVIVGIDSGSLVALGRWPWPRSVHTGLLNRINAAPVPPRSVFFDIDFSSQQSPLEDAALQQALQRAQERIGSPVRLAAFKSDAGGDHQAPIDILPRPEFAAHARLVAVNREESPDGLTRSWRTSAQIGGRQVPSVIDPQGRLADGASVTIDYAISPASFPLISYVDLLDGHVSPDVLAGKDVYIGNVAPELGDMVAVPLYGSRPGIVVQAMATETVAQGVPRAPPAWAAIVLLAGWAAIAALALRGRWRRNLAVLLALYVAIAAVALYGFAAQRLWLDIAAPMLLVTLAFGALTLRALDRQTWRALAYALGMRRREALLRSIVQSSVDCIVCIDERGTIRTANHAATRLLGAPRHELVDAPLGRFIGLFAGELDAARLAAMHGELRECDARTAAGAVFPVEVCVSRVRLQSEKLFTAFVRDIRERRAQQHRLQHQATHDSLTGLPNRAALMTQLENALGTAPQARGLSLLMLDLCRFKEVNDALGHHVGDTVLCEVAQRFEAALGERGSIARIGGDEFTVVLDAEQGSDGAADVSQALSDCLRTPIEVAGIAIEVGVSIGIARAPEDARDAQTLLRHADVAMYSAKRRGSPFEFYDAASDENTVRRLEIGGELRAAIGGNALELHFQPQVNLHTGQVDSCEALVRWFHPQKGPIPPAEFVSIAESTELIRPLTEWTLAAALAQIGAWRDRGVPVRVAVNLSARLLQDIAFPQQLARLLATAGVPAGSLELEITESAMMLDPARALAVIQDVHRLGVLIAIDDFGTGYSSLGYLRDLPVHALKLDKSFVKGMRASADDRVIVESTAQMAHALGLKLVAEGVESEWDARFLAAAGYDFAQGYRYAPALPAGKCLAWIVEYNATARQAANETARIRVAMVPGPELREGASEAAGASR